jgi:putative MATE family efflux protein
VWAWDEIARIGRLALPNMIEQAIQHFGYIAFTGLVAALGTASLAAHQVADAVEALAYMPAFGFAVAAASLVGQSLGAGDPALAERIVRRTAQFCVALMVIVGAAFVLFNTQLAAFFTPQPEVRVLAANAIMIAAFEVIGMALYMLYANVLRGAGDTRSPTIVALLNVVVIRLSVVWLLTQVYPLGLAGVWIGTAVDWTVRAIVLYALYRRGHWKYLKL